MKLWKLFFLIFLILLGASSGIMKMLLMPQDVEFFGKYGINGILLIIFGVIQLISGILLIFKKYRKIGGYTLGITFLTSSVLIFLDGNVIFGLISLLPLVVIWFIIK